MILDKIIKCTEKRVENKKKKVAIDDLISKINLSDKNTVDYKNDNINSKFHNSKLHEKNSFEENLKSGDISFICEVKKASPSKGLICKDLDHVKIAKEYEKIGSSAISVLTEPYFFKGKDDYLVDVVRSVNLPVLRKDFIIDEYMIYESKILGASAILLISSILNKNDLEKYIDLSYKLNMYPLVEVHTYEEIKIAINAGGKIIGVNNRNLKNFEVNINTSINLRKYVPENMVFVSESGIKSANDIKTLKDNNIDAVLIGESLMKSNDKKLAMNDLRSLI
ncbi:MAG: indole-3-glycerol phosphate synthase TrpC [Methanobacteriaceae archaeon]|jgi:indole-3-glycerol phosphate synthase|nr:indole-3-glycerol phosphate synthase TrpC [Candidatus Methanorudis spinitermitis]